MSRYGQKWYEDPIYAAEEAIETRMGDWTGRGRLPMIRIAALISLAIGIRGYMEVTLASIALAIIFLWALMLQTVSTVQYKPYLESRLRADNSKQWHFLFLWNFWKLSTPFKRAQLCLKRVPLVWEFSRYLTV